MKKIYIEILAALIFVVLCTAFIYNRLSTFGSFWNAQFMWSVILALGWIMVSIGYYHQGSMVRNGKNAANVSLALPTIVFIVQCILFVKGIYYGDWSLIFGAIVVNSGVVFNIYQITRVRYFPKK